MVIDVPVSHVQTDVVIEAHDSTLKFYVFKVYSSLSEV